MTTPLHADADDTSRCPSWCVGRTGQPHDVDDVYGVEGTHHDSRITSVTLAGDDGSQVHVRASQFEPLGADPWPAVVEVDADLAETRRRLGPCSVWLTVTESRAVVAALRAAMSLVLQS